MTHTTLFALIAKRFLFLGLIVAASILGYIALAHTPFSSLGSLIRGENSTTTLPTSAALPTPSPEPQVAVPVLMYHYIRTVPNPDEDRLGYNLSVTPENFEAQMNYLYSRGYTTLTPDDLDTALRNKDPNLPDKPIILTFDDGYTDFYTEAFPVLKRYNLKATAYIVSGFLSDSQNRYLTWSQLRELDSSGLITIGGHTLHHANVAVSANAATEITQNKTVLEKFLGHPVTSFAYPGGTFNETAVNLVDQAGYQLAFTTQPGSHHKKSQRLTLDRVRITGYMKLDSFVKALSEAY